MTQPRCIVEPSTRDISFTRKGIPFGDIFSIVISGITRSWFFITPIHPTGNTGLNTKPKKSRDTRSGTGSMTAISILPPIALMHITSS